MGFVRDVLFGGKASSKRHLRTPKVVADDDNKSSVAPASPAPTLRGKCQALKRALNRKRSEMKMLEDRNVKLNAIAAQQSEVATKNLDQVRELWAMHDEQNAAIAALKEENVKATALAAARDDEIRALKDALLERDSALAGLREENSILVSQVAQLGADLNASEEKASSLASELANAHEVAKVNASKLANAREVARVNASELVLAREVTKVNDKERDGLVKEVHTLHSALSQSKQELDIARRTPQQPEVSLDVQAALRENDTLRQDNARLRARSDKIDSCYRKTLGNLKTSMELVKELREEKEEMYVEVEKVRSQSPAPAPAPIHIVHPCNHLSDMAQQYGTIKALQAQVKSVRSESASNVDRLQAAVNAFSVERELANASETTLTRRIAELEHQLFLTKGAYHVSQEMSNDMEDEFIAKIADLKTQVHYLTEQLDDLASLPGTPSLMSDDGSSITDSPTIRALSPLLLASVSISGLSTKPSLADSLCGLGISEDLLPDDDLLAMRLDSLPTWDSWETFP